MDSTAASMGVGARLGTSRRLVHNSILARIGVSGKAGAPVLAVHRTRAASDHCLHTRQSAVSSRLGCGGFYLVGPGALLCSPVVNSQQNSAGVDPLVE